MGRKRREDIEQTGEVEAGGQVLSAQQDGEARQ